MLSMPSESEKKTKKTMAEGAAPPSLTLQEDAERSGRALQAQIDDNQKRIDAFVATATSQVVREMVPSWDKEARLRYAEELMPIVCDIVNRYVGRHTDRMFVVSGFVSQKRLRSVTR